MTDLLAHLDNPELSDVHLVFKTTTTELHSPSTHMPERRRAAAEAALSLSGLDLSGEGRGGRRSIRSRHEDDAAPTDGLSRSYHAHSFMLAARCRDDGCEGGVRRLPDPCRIIF